ncbi:hypothetical protein ES288_A01G221700v1 [Gossypium darwinii]|uniref:Retrotransposon gag domain-containing protein n=1 Tax=Gossypium darwinii TaxID=34276 RepID=A0A5D2HP43_GOSDA|nr:hypothetical protein ES288_A01G221700v1 [Gossypium darwinii]
MADNTRLARLDTTVTSLQHDLSAQATVLNNQSTALSSLQSIVTTQQNTMEDINRQLQNLNPILTEKQPFPERHAKPDGFTTESSATGNRRRPVNDDDYNRDDFPFKPKPARVELSKFDGSDPESWIFNANEFFDFYDIDDTVRITMAAFHFEGKARRWYRWMKTNKQLSCWDHFTRAMLDRFKFTTLEEPQGLLSKLQQTTTVEEYQSRFESLSNLTTDLPPSFFVDCFISGLRADIKNEVLSFRPTTLNHAISLARLQEAKLSETRKLLLKQIPYPKSFTPGLLPNPSIPLKHTPDQSKSPIPPAARRLTQAEAQRRRELNLCFYCDEKYVRGHKCNKPQLFLLDDTYPSDDDKQSPQPLEPPTDRPNSTDTPIETPTINSTLTDSTATTMISYNAMSGCLSPATLRFMGTIQGHSVQILLDGGSTHNFIQSRVAQFLGLDIDPSASFPVLVGNGESIHSEGRVKNVNLHIQGTDIIADFYVLPLHGSDVVLGVDWLATLGPIITDYASSTFQFGTGSLQVTWQGLHGSGPKQIQLNSLRRTHEVGAVAAFYSLQISFDPSYTTPNTPTAFTPLLNQFRDVFTRTSGLPPTRPTDHSIHLKPNSAPINVRPYRYPHFQK